jgi:glucosamine kinase
MGTGSNSCYYDGSRIVSNVSPLGYILGDEGGGAVLGRKLVAAVLKKQVPKNVQEKFFHAYKLSPSEILENVYMKPFPNRFLGQFAKFISTNIDVPELQQIVNSSFDEFINRNLLQYPEAHKLPVHFTGSIAFYFKSFLEDRLVRHKLTPGIFTLTPMDNLIRYHIINIDKILI